MVTPTLNVLLRVDVTWILMGPQATFCNVLQEYFHKLLHPTTKILKIFCAKLTFSCISEGITCSVQKVPSDRVKISH